MAALGVWGEAGELEVCLSRSSSQLTAKAEAGTRAGPAPFFPSLWARTPSLE